MAENTQSSTLPQRRVVAVIGHGKSPVGKGWGKRIDDCDLVVRMWDWHWQNPDDYGRKFDVGFLELAPSLMKTFYKYKQHEPVLGWVASALWQPHLCQLPQCCEIVDQSKWTEIGMRLGGIGQTGRLQFTRGTIATCWTIEYVSEGDLVVLVGFDNIKKGRTLSVKEGFPADYVIQPSTFSFRGYVSGARRYGNHDFGIELPVMCHIAEQRGVELAFADDTW